MTNDLHDQMAKPRFDWISGKVEDAARTASGQNIGRVVSARVT